MARALVAILWISLLPITARSSDKKDEMFRKKQELENIQADVEQSRRRLDSLRQLEADYHLRISERDQKIAGNETVIRRLNRELRALKNSIESAIGEHAEGQNELERSRRRYLGDIRRFYLVTREGSDLSWGDPNEEIVANRRVILLTAIAGHESGIVSQASEFLEQARQESERLSSERKRVDRLKEGRLTSTSLEKSKKALHKKKLEAVRRRSEDEADNLHILTEMQREMEEIVVQLERAQASRRAERDGTPSFFASLRGQLRSPYRGKIIESFGKNVNPVTNLESFSPGIRIKGRSGRSVVAVAAGSVVHVDTLRGYGEFVIIDHDGQYFTTYAGLSQILVSKGQFVSSEQKLASASLDGTVRFELRKGREPLDPVKWIRIDSF
jgi:septal ring factor EnvC (AmiA/AmiB activator)